MRPHIYTCPEGNQYGSADVLGWKDRHQINWLYSMIKVKGGGNSG
tara:strand:- start:190 stop:324 length:135 start_codon:yes stop_codon:yes gene_type:complete